VKRPSFFELLDCLRWSGSMSAYDQSPPDDGVLSAVEL